MELHRFGVGAGQGERCSDASGRANRSEQIGVFVALICGLARPGSASCPLSNLAVLLADPGFVLKPDLDRRRLRQAVEMSAQRAREVFLNASTIRSSRAGWRGRALMCEKPSCFNSFPTWRAWKVTPKPW
jgi:hypothetical protein